MKIRVFGDDGEAVLTCPVPDFAISGLVKTKLDDVETPFEFATNACNKKPREVLVEQQLYEALGVRRSRADSNSTAAFTSSFVSSGKSATICVIVIPDAR